MSLPIKKRTLRKLVSSVTAITTIVWLSGVSMLAVPLTTQAVSISDGDLIRSDAKNPDGTPALSSLDVYIVKIVGSKKFKRLILNPEVFNSYGHLKWENIKTVSESVMDEYTTSSLVRVDGDEKVYALAPNGDTGSKSWINLTADEFLSEPNTDPDSIYTINSFELGIYDDAGDITTVAQLTDFYTNGNLPSTGEGETVALAADTPASAIVAKGANNVEFTKINFSAGSSAYTVNSIAVTRGGIANDTDISAVKLYDGATQIGSSQAVNTTTHKATFTGLNWVIPANTTKTLTIKANISSSAGTNSVTLGIASASDIDSTATALSGTFPITGNAMSIASISVGTLTVDVLGTPAASNINSGSTEQHVASIKFSANSTEGINVQSFKLTQVGTASDSDISNIVVKYGTETLATVAGFVSSSATVTLSPALSLNAGASKTVDVYVDVASGINTSRTVKLEITQADDVTAIGSNSQGAVTVAAAGTFPEQGAAHTISQGQLSVSLDAATNPSSQNYVKGTTERELTALRFSATSTEGVRVTQITLTSAGTATPTDVSNFTLWKDGTQIATGSISGSGTGFTVQFGTNTVNSFDSPGLFDIDASSNAVVMVKADISTAATTDNTIQMNVASASHIKADGLSSQVDLPASSITGTTTASTFTIAASGSLSVSLNPSSPSASTISKGVQGYEFTKIDLTAGSGEDITVSSVTVRTYVGSGTTNPASTGDITNMRIMVDGEQKGTTVANPTDGVGAFSVNLVIPAGTTKTLSVIADVPVSTTASSLHIDLPGAGSVSADITSTGNSSGADITETGSATGNLMTVANPTLTVAMSSTPAASNKVVNSTEVTIGRILLTAGSAEDVKVSSIKVSFDDDATWGTTDTSSANSDLRNVKLYDGATQVGDTVSVITDGTPDYAQFTGIGNLTVPAGQTKAIDIKVDIMGGASTTYYAGVAAAGDVTGTGATSSTSVSSTGTGVSAGMTVQTSGTLTVSVSADSPVNANIAVGTTGVNDVEFAKFKFAAQYEPVKIKSLTLTRSGGADSDFVKVKLYADGVQIGPDGYVSGGTVVFNFPSGSEYEIPADSYKVITVKADLNGIGNGVTHADAPIWTINNPSTDVTGEGVQSGNSVSPSSALAVTPAAKTLYKTIATVTLNTTAFTGASGGSAIASATQKVLAVDIANGGPADLTVTTFNPTPATSGTPTGTTGIKLYWSDDLSTVIGSGPGTGLNGELVNGGKVSVTLTGNTTVPANTTKTIIVTADTVGLTTNNAFHLDLAAVSDFGWTPDGGTEVTTLTKNLPITGPTFTY